MLLFLHVDLQNEEWKVRFRKQQSNDYFWLEENEKMLMEFKSKITNEIQVIHEYVELGWNNITLNKEDDLRLLNTDKVLKFHECKKDLDERIDFFNRHQQFLYR